MPEDADGADEPDGICSLAVATCRPAFFNRAAACCRVCSGPDAVCGCPELPGIPGEDGVEPWPTTEGADLDDGRDVAGLPGADWGDAEGDDTEGLLGPDGDDAEGLPGADGDEGATGGVELAWGADGGDGGAVVRFLGPQATSRLANRPIMINWLIGRINFPGLSVSIVP